MYVIYFIQKRAKLHLNEDRLTNIYNIHENLFLRANNV